MSVAILATSEGGGSGVALPSAKLGESSLGFQNFHVGTMYCRCGCLATP